MEASLLIINFKFTERQFHIPKDASVKHLEITERHHSHQQPRWGKRDKLREIPFFFINHKNYYLSPNEVRNNNIWQSASSVEKTCDKNNDVDKDFYTEK